MLFLKIGDVEEPVVIFCLLEEYVGVDFVKGTGSTLKGENSTSGGWVEAETGLI